MAREVTLTMKRVFNKGLICFQVPNDEGLKTAIRDILAVCQKKNNDYVQVTLARPFVPRSTGPKSQNHHLNGHIMQICEYTGNDYDTIKYCIKMIAVEQMGYPFVIFAGHIVPKKERKSSTEECAMLIEASHILAAQLGMTLRETE